MYGNTEDKIQNLRKDINRNYNQSRDVKTNRNIHVPAGVSQVSQLVVMILLINDCYVMTLVVIISRINFVLYQNNKPHQI